MQKLQENNEQRLVELLQSGDKTALRDFYTLYAGQLTAVCARYIDDDDDLKDVFQDTLLGIISKISTFTYKGPKSLKAWATKVAVNQSLMFLRRRNKFTILGLDRDIADEQEDEEPDIQDLPPEELHRLIRDLPVGYRTVLNLFVFEGWTHKQIADYLGIKKATSASQFSKAKNLLSKKIKDYHKLKHLPH